MIGIFFFFLVAVWFFFTWWLTLFLTRRMESGPKTTVVECLLFLILLVLPLIDEIVGGIQFAQLCKANSTVQFDRMKAAGKTVYLSDVEDINVKGTWVPIRLQPWRYIDAVTGEPIVTFNILHATGGWLIRTLGIFEGNAPISFNSYCAPGGSRAYVYDLFRKLNIKNIDRQKN